MAKTMMNKHNYKKNSSRNNNKSTKSSTGSKDEQDNDRLQSL